MARFFELKGGQSLTSRLWDLLWMLRVASGQTGEMDRLHSQVLVDVDGDGHPEVVRVVGALRSQGNGAEPVFTILVEGED